MAETRPGFIALTRDNGARALVRADTISNIMHNKVSRKGSGGEKETVDALSLQIGPGVTITAVISEVDLLQAMARAMALASVVVEEVPISEA